jgi:hypothetical protein
MPQEPLERLQLEISRQPTDSTCGPTCLHSIYKYYEDDISLEQVIEEVQMLEDGGTLAVLMAIHALRRGYRVTAYTYNLEVFDPTWFTRPKVNLLEKLKAQVELKKGKRRLRFETNGYLEFIKMGGQLRFEDLRPGLIRRYLVKGVPIITGLSSTYLYHESRELPDTTPDDLAGEPQGHFVVLSGYDREDRRVYIADPYTPNPHSRGHHYNIAIERVIGSIFLGILTYDANLLIIEPAENQKGN